MQDIVSVESRAEEKRIYWNKIVLDFNASGQNQTNYCKTHGLNKDHFCYYLRQWRKHNLENSQGTTKLSFLPVEINPSPSKWILNIDNNFSLELPEALSIEQLTAFILNLRKKLC